MHNLIAYIPAFNKRHYAWLEKYSNCYLNLISQEEAETLLPRLSRMRTIGLSSGTVCTIIDSLQLVRVVTCLNNPENFSGKKVIMPDEDVCHAFAEKYLFPKKIIVIFEKIWARYDMTAVKSKVPIQSSLKTSSDSSYREFVSLAYKMAEKSPDWWRQVGAVIFRGDTVLSSGFNEHFPCEYEQDALGDPRMNYEAGEVGEYLSLHAERSSISRCAREGVSTLGASIFVTCFPCVDCSRWIVNAGIKAVFFIEGYSNLNAQEIFKVYGVDVIKINDPDRL